MYFATAKQMEKLDRLAVDSGLEILQMMELAGWHMAQLFRLLKIPKTAKVAIIVGKGNNGGDGLSAARFLANAGLKVKAILTDPNLNQNAQHHLQLVGNMGIPVLSFRKNKLQAAKTIRNADILIDAIFGYHLKGTIENPFAEIIRLINQAPGLTIAYDLPSGLDATTGKCAAECIAASATLSLALPKTAFKTSGDRKLSGKIFVADLGIPKYLYDQIKPGSRPNFNTGIVKVF
ncbi:MAG: NAD(P)H-hydrate epimerase [Candidatus Doudnabacteria bacterium]|nr:NAD(P)H-hydrate epimerase [Candidatus Doudnabacteria bacterium]